MELTFKSISELELKAWNVTAVQRREVHDRVILTANRLSKCVLHSRIYEET